MGKLYLYLFTRQQFGFLFKCSTCTQLLDSVNDWTLTVRNRRSVDVIYFDFAKAFDSVIFIYINDIVDLFDGSDVRVKLYVDDIKIYLEITNDTDCATLQTFIDKITVWSHSWQLKLANKKCQHSGISLSRAICPADYYVTDVKLPTVHNVRDLGVLIDSHLTFRDHINSIVSRGHLRSMQIWRCFLCKGASILCKAFTTYVRPMLEYCSPIWSPVAVTLINQLESVQRRFTKQLPGLQTLPYDERCALLGLDRLELRRLRADLILCYKIIRRLVLLSPDSFFTFICNSRTRGHSFKLFLPDSRVNF